MDKLYSLSCLREVHAIIGKCLRAFVLKKTPHVTPTFMKIRKGEKEKNNTTRNARLIVISG